MTDIWKEKYESFTEQWSRFIESVGQIEINQSDPDAKMHALRMQKLIAHLGAVIESIEPQLLGDTTLDALNENINLCLAYLNSADFRNTNHHLDVIATHLGAFHLASVVKEKPLKKLVEQLNEHNDVVSKMVTESHSKSENLLTKINEKNTEIDDIFGKISQYSKELFEDDGENKSTRTRISNVEAELGDKENQIQEIYQRLFQWNEAEQTVAEHIETLHGDVSQKIHDIEEELSEINEYHVGIFGEKDEDGEPKGGLKQAIEARKQALDDFANEQRKIIEDLKERIDDLLSGATNAGLASAYNQLKEEAHQNEWWFRVYFILCVAALFILGFYFFHETELKNLSDWGRNALSASPIMTPLAILTAFFSKRRSEQHRLKQEYAHKEALAKSYDSFKKQVDALAKATDNEKEKEVLLNHLMKTMIDAIGFNAAKTLDKKHGDDTPPKEILNSVIKNQQ